MAFSPDESDRIKWHFSGGTPNSQNDEITYLSAILYKWLNDEFDHPHEKTRAAVDFALISTFPDEALDCIDPKTRFRIQVMFFFCFFRFLFFFYIFPCRWRLGMAIRLR